MAVESFRKESPNKSEPFELNPEILGILDTLIDKTSKLPVSTTATVAPKQLVKGLEKIRATINDVKTKEEALAAIKDLKRYASYDEVSKIRNLIEPPQPAHKSEGKLLPPNLGPENPTKLRAVEKPRVLNQEMIDKVFNIDVEGEHRILLEDMTGEEKKRVLEILGQVEENRDALLDSEEGLRLEAEGIEMIDRILERKKKFLEEGYPKPIEENPEDQHLADVEKEHLDTAADAIREADKINNYITASNLERERLRTLPRKLRAQDFRTHIREEIAQDRRSREYRALVDKIAAEEKKMLQNIESKRTHGVILEKSPEIIAQEKEKNFQKIEAALAKPGSRLSVLLVQKALGLERDIFKAVKLKEEFEARLKERGEEVKETPPPEPAQADDFQLTPGEIVEEKKVSNDLGPEPKEVQLDLPLRKPKGLKTEKSSLDRDYRKETRKQAEAEDKNREYQKLNKEQGKKWEELGKNKIEKDEEKPKKANYVEKTKNPLIKKIQKDLRERSQRKRERGDAMIESLDALRYEWTPEEQKKVARQKEKEETIREIANLKTEIQELEEELKDIDEGRIPEYRKALTENNSQKLLDTLKKERRAIANSVFSFNPLRWRPFKRLKEYREISEQINDMEQIIKNGGEKEYKDRIRAIIDGRNKKS